MKLSFMTFMCPQWTLEEVIAGAKRHGYEGVELRVAAEHRHGVEVEASAEARGQARRVFEDVGIEIACIATSCRLADGDSQARAANVESLRKHIELAADVGAPLIRVFGGQPSGGLSLDDAVKVAAEDLTKACEEACARGVTLCLETHDAFSLGETVGQVLRLADKPCLRANWDLMHPYNHGEAPWVTRRALRGKVAHVHMHDYVLGNGAWRLVPPRQGVMPLSQFLRMLRDDGYDGYLSAEYWDELGPPEEALALYAGAMRPWMTFRAAERGGL